jgi:hypothetical protein
MAFFGALLVHFSLQMTCIGANESAVNTSKQMNECEYKQVSVPKILTPIIPEILARLAIAGKDRTLSVPPVGRPVERREEDVGSVKTSQSILSWPLHNLDSGNWMHFPRCSPPATVLRRGRFSAI